VSDLKPIFYDSVDAIEAIHWDVLGCCNNLYYTPEFLKAFEIANPDIVFKYIIVFKDNLPVAFANTQKVSISVKTITKNIKILAWLKRTVNRLFSSRNIRILFVGNVFLSGEYGTFLRDGEDKVEMFKAIAEAVKKLSKSTKKLNGIFVKDFKQESLPISDHLIDFNYAKMQVEPNMIITLNPEWQSFEDYKNALKSKYRVKANKADSKSKTLIAKRFTGEDIANYKGELQGLYENTITNANFNAQILNLNTFYRPWLIKKI